MRLGVAAVGALASLVMGSQALASMTVYDTGNSSSVTGIYTPFSTGTNLDHKFGDSGWITGDGAGAPAVLDSITLGFSVFTSGTAGVLAGSTSLLLTINNGDPSGLQFGPGTQLYSTKLTGVVLPAFDPALGNTVSFTVTVPLPNVVLAGGYNNVGWSVGVADFDYAAQFGFETYAQNVPVGFDVYGASEFVPGSGWHTFGFTGGVANFGALITSPVPEPGGMGCGGGGWGGWASATPVGRA